MRNYEIMYILVPTLDDAGVKTQKANLAEIITKNNGKILKEDFWGLKDFAYEMKHHKKGYYNVLTINAEPKAIAEFNRLGRINKNVLRHMIISLNHQEVKEEK